MLSYTFNSLVAALALHTSIVSSHRPITSLKSRRLTEYQLPPATETHEFARIPGTDFVFLSQMSDSVLIKIQLDAVTEAPIAYQSFPMGSSDKSGLHGIWPSTLYPGKVWMTLQHDNKLLLVDPGCALKSPPSIIETIDIPAPGNGPHCVYETGGRVWASLKTASKETGGYYVFSANMTNTTDQKLYPCLNSPVFIQEDPTTKLIYVTQDTDSSIMRINQTSGETVQLPIPPSIGRTPVGMTTVSGPLAGVWFSLAGNSTGGSGSFGRVTSTGELQFFRLRAPQLRASSGLLHVADASTEEGGPALWLLSTSLLSSKSPDALIRVSFDAAVTSVTGEEYIAMLTQNAMVHRVVPLAATVLVSQLHTFALAQLTYNNTIAGQWLPADVANNTAVYNMNV
ncbi:uncharacterized protein G6M90_00g079050 [Metarhizium brunneum]|uniref:Uncharacterized protein n=1 Tax=Metarhizium brunneum TaxID=500148 RepID=A0A7D5Z1A4_9HYPO